MLTRDQEEMGASTECGTAAVRFNGISGATGGYPFARTTVADLAAMARGELLRTAPLARAARWLRGKLGLWRETRDPFSESRLETAGWGVIFGRGGDPRIREALRPLLDWRKAGAAAVEERRYFETWDEEGYRPGESKQGFLTRYGAESGAVDPRRLPYYLMLVGGPDEIPFSFQYELDLRHAVGRLDLERPEDFANYAASVIAAERAWSAPSLPASAAARDAAFFCPLNPDPMSARMRRELVGGLLARFEADPAPGWQLQQVLEADASKEALQQLLGGRGRPAFLFTACHGLVFDLQDGRQREKQGALLCSAEAARHPLEAAVAASDISDEACPHGLIAMHFACYGAGTPTHDEFARQPVRIAPAPFTARLPQRLLAHPRGGALAVIGHVERAWSHSFTGYGKAPRLNTFEDVIRRLLGGSPVGHALELVNFRYMEMAAKLLEIREREELEPAAGGRDVALAEAFCAVRDARNYVVLGDPAARLLPVASAMMTGAPR